MLIAEGTGISLTILEKLHKTAEKTESGSHMKKTEYMDYKHDRERHLEESLDKFICKQMDKFKCLGKWFQPSGLDKGRARKIKLVCRLVLNRLNN